MCTVTYKKKSYLVFLPGSAMHLLKPLEFPKSHKDVFYYVNEGIFGTHLKMEPVARKGNHCDYRLGTFSPPHNLPGGWKDQRLNQLPVVHDFIDQACVRKPP